MKKLTLCLVITLALLAAGCASSPSPGISSAGSIYKNGTYVGYSDANEDGYGVAMVTVAADKIVAVELTEITEMGLEKDYISYPHQPVVDAVNLLAAQFVEENTSDIDTYTGATHSTQKWEKAVSRALEKAKVDNDNESTYFDGVFQGQSELNHYNQRAIALLTIKEDRITDIILRQTRNDSDGFKERDTYEYEAFFAAQEKMAERFIEAGTTAVDTFTGATSSSKDWITAVEAALENAKR